MDKMREEFEAWFLKEKSDKVNENYQFLTKEIMYEGWKASRSALCVELPSGLTEKQFTKIAEQIENFGGEWK